MMDFVIGFMPKIDQLELVSRAEDLGFSHFGAGEGALLFSDPYQFLALAARDTRSIKLGTYVTNPLTRVAPQTANSIATLNSLAPGRVFLGVGAANNAMRSLGQRVATMRELEDSVRVTRALLRGERVDYSWGGEAHPIEFLDPDGGWYNVQDDVPLWMAAGGPRSLELAARVADAVVYCLGPDPSLIRAVRSSIDRAATEAGRDPASVKLIGLTFFYMLRPGEGLNDAIINGFGSAPLAPGATNIKFILEHQDELPRGIVEASKAAAAMYNDRPADASEVHHLETWKQYLKGLDPGHVNMISKEMTDFFCIWGNPDECRAQAEGMLAAGVDTLSVFLSNPNGYVRDMEDISATLLQS